MNQINQINKNKSIIIYNKNYEFLINKLKRINQINKREFIKMITPYLNLDKLTGLVWIIAFH